MRASSAGWTEILPPSIVAARACVKLLRKTIHQLFTISFFPFAFGLEKKKKLPTFSFLFFPFKRRAPRSPPAPRAPPDTAPGTSYFRARHQTPLLPLRPAPAPRGAARGAGPSPPEGGPTGAPLPVGGGALWSRPCPRPLPLLLLLLLLSPSEAAAAPRAHALGVRQGATRKTKTELGFRSHRFLLRRRRRRQTRPSNLRRRCPAAPPAWLPRR